MATWTAAEIAELVRADPLGTWQHDPRILASCWPYDETSNFAPDVECLHRPDTTYTKRPCSCGRELYPPRGRGRGESLTSPRRIAAKLRALDAMELHTKGYTYAEIATLLGYRDHSGPAHAVQRIRDQEAAWYRWQQQQEESGQRRYRQQRQPTEAEAVRILAELEAELSTGGLDGQRLASASRRLRKLLQEKGKRQVKRGVAAQRSREALAIHNTAR